MKKYLFFAAMAMSACLSLSAQQPAKPKDKAAAEKPQKVQLKPYGFIRNYLVFDSRRTVAVCGGDYVMIPYDEDWNIPENAITGAALPYGSEERFDRNATPQTHLHALSSRFGLDLWGPKILKANSSGRLEADFAGFGTTNTVLRLRLAYMRLDWNGESAMHSLVVGQDWHPLSGSIMPEVLGMAAGAPFRPHSRTPQIRYEMGHGLLHLTAAALYQYQYTSPGPNGESTQYANQGLVPELFLGIGLRNDKVYTQLGVDYSNLKISETMSSLPDGTASAAPYRFSGRVGSLSPTLYFQYTPGLFSLKMRSTVGQNLGHLNMLSGYARTLKDGDASQWYYMPLTSSVSYIDIAYGKQWRTNLLLGYMKNLGLDNGYSIDGTAIYMKKGITNINSIYRIAPSISYNTKAFNIGLEYEWTAVAYGDLQSDGTVADNANLHQVANSRICLLVKYNF